MNVTYTLKDNGRGLALSTWNNTANEFIFERTVDSEEHACKAIKQLLEDRFIIPTYSHS